MLQENIWEKSLNDEVSSEKCNSILIKRTTPHKLTLVELRNYFNTHELNEINVNSMYEYFEENMFTDYSGLYLPHLICSVPFISLEKVCRALDEVFQVISPNTGSNTEDNYNYFQYYMLIWRRKNLWPISSAFEELYELGINHGLDLSYVDSSCMSNGFYFAASAPINYINENYNTFIVPENNMYDINGISIIEIIERRLYMLEKNITDRIEPLPYDYLSKRHKIFKSIEFYKDESLNNFNKSLFYHVRTISSEETREFEIYQELEKKLIKVKSRYF